MKLVMIQGDVIARYEGRQQCEVVRVPATEHDYSAAEMVEDFRVNGVPKEAERDQA